MSVQEETEKLTNQSPSPIEAVNSPGAGNVDRIREILFGPQIREYEQRLTRTEERISQENGELRADVRRRFDADLLSRTHTDSIKSLEKGLGQFNDQLSKDLRDLRHLTLERIKNLLDDFSLQMNTQESVQNRHLEELRATSVNRFALASMLTEVAARVRNGSGVLALGETGDGGPNP